MTHIFNISDDVNWKNHLNNNGYVVVSNVMNDKDCNDNISRIWDWLEGLGSGIDRNNPNTWKNDRWPQNIHGIIQHYKVGQSQFVWDIRCNKNIINIFEKIWNTHKLLCSFDGICIMKPPELCKGGHYKSWIHTDQSPKKEGMHSIQGFINLEHTGPDDGCFTCFPKSHTYHKQLFEHNNIKFSKDWYKLNESDIDWLKNKNLNQCRIEAPKGSMVLWDSRIFHCNAGVKNLPRIIPKWRYVVYICMTPKSKCNDKNLQKKIKAFNDLRMTSHWPHHIKLFPNKPRTYGNVVPEFKLQKEIPELTDTGKRLAGLLEYE